MRLWARPLFLILILVFNVAAQSQLDSSRSLPKAIRTESALMQDALHAHRRKDFTAALAILRPLANQGSARAQQMLGGMYASGAGVARDQSQAMQWYRKAAEQGSAGAQLVLGLAYERGDGVPKDPAQAVLWYSKAAESGDTHAQVNLGVIYENGRGVTRDLKRAADLYRKAAEQGLDVAQLYLGNMYLWGRGVDKDAHEAVRWYRKAAEQGDSDAQYNLGNGYYNGDGVVKDHRVAFQWYKKCADQGEMNGQFAVGAAYAAGDGVLKDDQQAVFWSRKAAEQGHPGGQVNLGNAYNLGIGVPKDESRAYFWWLLAAAGGNDDVPGVSKAKGARDSIEQKLTPEQRSTAQAAASNWRRKTAEQAEALAHGNSKGEGGLNQPPSRTTPSSAQADATGSGFRVARGVIVTNYHVIDGCNRLRVNGVAAQVRGSDARSDLALLNSNLPGPSTTLRAQRAAVGEPVAVAGYPLHGLLSGFNMTTGNLSSLSGIGGDTRLVQITSPVQPGNSGGPVLDSAGNLMGVVVSKLDAIKAAKITGDIAQNVNFAINANVLRSFLDANSVEYETASSDKPIASTATAAKAKGFTVLVECWK